jgi:hypothetical protein
MKTNTQQGVPVGSKGNSLLAGELTGQLAKVDVEMRGKGHVLYIHTSVIIYCLLCVCVCVQGSL